MQRNLTKWGIVGSVACLTGLLVDDSAWARQKIGGRNNVRVTVVHKDVEFQLDENVIVRKQYPPDMTDDKGNPRKPTSAELRELKGPDTTLPGYKGEIFDLKNGAVVTVQLYKKKDTKTAETPKDTKVGDKPDTAGWIKAGTLSGKIVGAGKNTSTLTLQIDTAALTKGGYHSHSNDKTNKVTIPDTKVTQVMILSKDIPDTDPQPEKKKKK